MYITEENEKDYSLYSEKDPFKSVSCCRFQFHYSDKKVDRLRECSKKTKHLYWQTRCITVVSLLRTLAHNFLVRLSKYCA